MFFILRVLAFQVQCELAILFLSITESLISLAEINVHFGMANEAKDKPNHALRPISLHAFVRVHLRKKRFLGC